MAGTRYQSNPLSQLKHYLQLIDQRIPPSVGDYCSLLVLLGGFYWIATFILCRAKIAPVPYARMVDKYMTDAGSGFAFIFFLVFVGIFGVMGLLFVGRTLWNLCEQWLKRRCYQHLHLIVRPLCLLTLFMSTLNDIPQIKSAVMSHYSQVNLLLTAVTYKSQSEAHNLGDFMEMVRNQPAQ